MTLFRLYKKSLCPRFSDQNSELIHIVSLVFIMSLLFFAPHQAVNAESVHIPDPGLRSVLELALGKAAGEDITQADMASLEVLQGRCRFSKLKEAWWWRDLWVCESTNDTFKLSIRDLTGLESAVNLKELHLARNRISDVSPLKDLTTLTQLALENNRISDVSPLKDLTNLTYLSLRNNRISDVSPLKDLTNLTYLDLDSSSVSDVSPLENMTNLRYLHLGSNRISNVFPLKNMTKLIYLDFESNEILDVSPLKDMTNLTYLDLDSNRISDISPTRKYDKSDSVRYF